MRAARHGARGYGSGESLEGAGALRAGRRRGFVRDPTGFAPEGVAHEVKDAHRGGQVAPRDPRRRRAHRDEHLGPVHASPRSSG